MSSFMVSSNCMSNIINGLFWNHNFKNLNSSIYSEQKLNQSNDFKKLAKRLFLLNQAALMYRYDDKPNSDYFKIPKFIWKDKEVSVYQVLKSLECLRYQCSEGTFQKGNCLNG